MMRSSGWKEFALGQGKHPLSLQIGIFCIIMSSLLAGAYNSVSAGQNFTVLLQQGAQQDQGYWKFLEVWTAYGPEAVPPNKSDATVSDGSMSGSFTLPASNGSPASTYSFSCTWFWQTQSGLDKLIPGEQITGSMTVTDTSSGKFGNALGIISFDQPYLPGGTVGGFEIKILEVSSGSLRSTTQSGQLSIPAGPGNPEWHAKMALKASCANKEGGYYERVYEWVSDNSAGVTTAKTTQPTPTAPGGLFGVPHWLIVVLEVLIASLLGLGLLAGGAVVVVILIRRRKMKLDEIEPQTSSAYSIKLSAASLEVRMGESAALDVEVFRITPEGEMIQAPDAPVRVVFPPSASGLLVTPTNGQGSLHCVFFAPQAEVSSQVKVTISTSAGGVKTSTPVIVHIVPSYSLQLASNSSENSIQPGGEGLWAWASVKSIPTDPQQPLDHITQSINFRVIGANQDWIVLKAPVFKDGMQGVLVSAVLPADKTALQDGNPYLIAECRVGSQKLQARLELALNSGLILDAWVNAQKQSEVVFDRSLSTPGWVFPDIFAYFHSVNEKDKPVVPNFKYSFPTSAVQIDPPVLNVVDFYERQPAQFTIKVAVKSIEDLERHFGKDLADRNGIINVQISINDETGQVYQAGVTYQLQPQIELFVQHRSETQHRIYRNLNLGNFEILADGENQLELIVACCRTDKSGAREIGGVRLVDPTWINMNNHLQGDASPGFELVSRNENSGNGILVAVVSSKPVIYSQERSLQKMLLHLEASLSERAPKNYLRTAAVQELEINPRYPDLRLWVVPGKKRGTSDGWMFLFLDHNPQQPLVACTLRIETTSPDSSGLKLTGGNDVEEVQTSNDGMAQVELHYEGLKWSNLIEAKYSVSCVLQAENGTFSDKLVREIDIARNVQRMLADLSQNSESLKLNNPYYQQENLLKVIRLTTYRPALRGPIWNISGALAAHNKESKEDKFFHDFVSSSYRNRIARWLCKRRNYQPGMPDKIDTIFEMNGIEFDNFSFGGLHFWEAVFLAGMDPMDDPRGLDPWWKQQWMSGEYLDPDGLPSKSWERYYFLEMSNWITAIGSGSLQVLMMAFFSTLGLALYLTIESITAVFQTYSAVFDVQYGPDVRYDPNNGYSYFDPAEGIPESKKLHTYVSRERFIADWIEAHPQG
jgi:hypothetical protein